MSRLLAFARVVFWGTSCALLSCACGSNKPQDTVLGDSNTNWITCDGPTWCGVVDAGAPHAVESEPDVAPPRWRAHASTSSMQEDETDLLFNPPEDAIDGVASTRWSSGKPQAGDEWFEVDFGESRTLSKVTLGLGLGSAVESMDDWPRGYSLSVSNQSMDRTAPPAAQGNGSAPVTEIQFAPQTGRYLLIRQTAVNPSWWSIHELNVE